MRLRQAWQVVEADHQKAVAEGRVPVEVDALAARKLELDWDHIPSQRTSFATAMGARPETPVCSPWAITVVDDSRSRPAGVA